MIESLVLGAASLLTSSTELFFEQEAFLAAGKTQIETQQDWNAVTLFSKDGSPLSSIEYFDGDTFVEWHPAENGVDHANNALGLIFFEDAQTEILIKSGIPANVVLHFFQTQRPEENLVAQFGETSQEFIDSNFFYKNGKNTPKFFSRSDWGADESLRVQSLVQRFFKPVDRRWFSKEIKAVQPKYRPVVKQTHDDNGKPLFWPISENQNIAKFIVHHTGEAVDRGSKNRRTPKELMRAIYYYHTVTRGWGDIGYNYIIDPDGNIYEGRAGGPKSFGAHTIYHNVGSMGVSLMGNFQYEQPTDAQIEVLSFLLADHARRFDIDPEKRSHFLGKNSFNISGHRDVARLGHGTACPGRNLAAKLPEIRKKSAEYMQILNKFEKEGVTSGRDFLQKSVSAKKNLKSKTFVVERKPGPIEISDILEPTIIQRGDSKFIEISVKNTSKSPWPQGAEMTIKDLPDGIIASKFRAIKDIPRGFSGKFRGKIYAKTAPNGNYTLTAWPSFLEKQYFENQIAKNPIEFPIRISGSTSLAFSKFPLQANSFTKTKIQKSADFFEKYKTNSVARPTEPNIKVKIADFTHRYGEFESSRTIEIWEGTKKLATVPARKTIKVELQESAGKKSLKITANNKNYGAREIKLKQTDPEGIMTIKNYWDKQYGYGRIKYNTFRGDFNIYPDTKNQLLVVNELPLEPYLWGLGEQPKTEPEAKKHAIFILARSYALTYSGSKRKFNTNKYDLEDDPATSQLYLGYDWERYHSNQKNMLKKTKGQVITYNGKPVIGPYFTQSSGESSAKWKRVYPWTKAQKLPYDEGLEARGHGVGLSGNSARKLAENGKSYTEILNHFFDGIKVQKRY